MVKSISNGGHTPSKIQKPQQPFAKALDKIASDKKTDKPTDSNQRSAAAPKADEPNSNTTLKEKVHSVVEHLRIGLPKLNNKADSKSDKKNDDAPKVEPSDNNKADVKSGKSDDDKVKGKSGKSDDDKADVKSDKKDDDDKPKASKSRKEIKAEAKAKMKEMLEQMKEAREAAKQKQEEMKAAAKQKQEEIKAAAKQKQEEMKAAAKQKQEEMKAAAKLKQQDMKIADQIKKVQLDGAAQLEKIQKMEKELAEKAKRPESGNVVKDFLDKQQSPDKQLENRNSSKPVVLPPELLEELAKPITPSEQKPPTSNKPGLPEIPTPPSKPPANNGTWTQSLFHDINEKYFGGITPGSGGFGLQFTS